MRKLLAATVLLSIPSTGRAGIVYSNTLTPIGTSVQLVAPGAADGVEIGNQVTFESPSSQRSVLHAGAVLSIAGSGEAEFDLRLRLYSGRGPQGEPGVLRWESPPLHTVINPSSDLFYQALVPNVNVDGCTWTVQISGRTGTNQAAISLPRYGPPTVGSGAPDYWTHDQGVWTVTPGDGPFGAQIVTNSSSAPDFDCDGDVGTDLDIEAFFECLAGGVCPGAPCDSEPPEGEYPDIEGFFRALAGA